MPFESRSRMISFRLTSEEYERFRELCLTNGIRSVSEMARAAINLLLQQPEHVPQVAIEGRVAALEGRFHVLALEMCLELALVRRGVVVVVVRVRHG